MTRNFAVLIPRPRWLIIGVCVSAAAHLVVMGGYLFVGETVREVVHRITFEPPAPPSVFWKPPRTTARPLAKN